MMRLLEWWARLTTKAQYLASAFFILISTLFLLAGRIWIWGWAVGFVLFCFSGSSNRGEGE